MHRVAVVPQDLKGLIDGYPEGLSHSTTSDLGRIDEQYLSHQHLEGGRSYRRCYCWTLMLKVGFDEPWPGRGSGVRPNPPPGENIQSRAIAPWSRHLKLDVLLISCSIAFYTFSKYRTVLWDTMRSLWSTLWSRGIHEYLLMDQVVWTASATVFLLIEHWIGWTAMWRRSTPIPRIDQPSIHAVSCRLIMDSVAGKEANTR